MEVTIPLKVCVTLGELLALRMRHLFSAADPEARRNDTGSLCGTGTLLSGYTAWESTCDLPVTIGWDWRIHPRQQGALWLREGLPRTNIQVMNREGQPLSPADNSRVLATWIDSLSWSDEVARAIA